MTGVQTCAFPIYQKDFYFFYMVLISGLSGIILASDLFNTYVFLEIVGISAYILVAYLQKDKALLASYKYLFMGSLGGTLFLLGLFIIYKNTGSLSLEAIRELGSLTDLPRRERNLCFSALITGLGIKTAFFPFHTWLPKAHPAAPSHVSGVMSGVIVKMGIYGILRVAGFLPQSLLMTAGEILMLISTATALYGILLSAIQKDLKRLLAFCTVENIGLVGMAIGLGMVGKSLSNHGMMMAGYGAALLHTLNHALFKPLLFFAAGKV